MTRTIILKYQVTFHHKRWWSQRTFSAPRLALKGHLSPGRRGVPPTGLIFSRKRNQSSTWRMYSSTWWSAASELTLSVRRTWTLQTNIRVVRLALGRVGLPVSSLDIKQLEHRRWTRIPWLWYPTWRYPMLRTRAIHPFPFPKIHGQWSNIRGTTNKKYQISWEDRKLYSTSPRPTILSVLSTSLVK